jgi:hypothetical protein
LPSTLHAGTRVTSAESVTGRVEGRQVFCSLARPELLQLLSAAEQLLEATGEAVTLCPRYGDPT